MIPSYLLRLTHSGQTTWPLRRPVSPFAAFAISSGRLEPYQLQHSISVLPSLTLIVFGSIMQQNSTWLHNADSSTAAVADFWSVIQIWSSGCLFTHVDVNAHILRWWGEPQKQGHHFRNVLLTATWASQNMQIILPPIVLPTSLPLVSELKYFLQQWALKKKLPPKKYKKLHHGGKTIALRFFLTEQQSKFLQKL